MRLRASSHPIVLRELLLQTLRVTLGAQTLNLRLGHHARVGDNAVEHHERVLEGRKHRPERDSYQPEQVDACQHGLYRGRPDRDLVRPGMERNSPGWEQSTHPVG